MDPELAEHLQHPRPDAGAAERHVMLLVMLAATAQRYRAELLTTVSPESPEMGDPAACPLPSGPGGAPDTELCHTDSVSSRTSDGVLGREGSIGSGPDGSYPALFLILSCLFIQLVSCQWACYRSGVSCSYDPIPHLFGRCSL